MAVGAEAVFVAVMVLFGVATAGVLAFALRDMVAEVAGDTTEADTGDAQRVAMLGPALYLVGFLLVAAATVVEIRSVAGVDPLEVGFALIVLAAVPMAVGFYLAWQTG